MTEVATNEKAVHFIVNDIHLCAYLKNIDKVLPFVTLTPIPESPTYLAGLMNIEGHHVPVIDLFLKLGFVRTTPYALDTPIILFSNAGKQIAVIVDEVLGLFDLDQNKLQADENINDRSSPFIASYVNDKDSYLLINISYLLDFGNSKDNSLYEYKSKTGI